MNQSVAEIVAQIRQNYSFTQEALARHLGVTFSTVNAWEAGRSMPQPRHRRRLEQMARPTEATLGALSILISDPFARPRKSTVRALHDAADALGLPLTVHEEADGVCALVKLGLLRPAVVIYRVPQESLDVGQLLLQLDRLPEMMANPVVLLTDDGQIPLATHASERVKVIVGSMTLGQAGAILRRATALSTTFTHAAIVGDGALLPT